MEMILTPAYAVSRQPVSCRKSFRLQLARIFASITIQFVLPDLPAECHVCTVPRRARSGVRASPPVTGAGTIASPGTLRWLTVLHLSAGYERDSDAVVVGAIGLRQSTS